MARAGIVGDRTLPLLKRPDAPNCDSIFMIYDLRDKLFKTPSIAFRQAFPARIYILLAIFKAATPRRIPIDRGYQGGDCLQNTIYTSRQMRGIALTALISHLAPKSATGSRGVPQSINSCGAGRSPARACGTVATGARHELILKASIHARDSYASRLFRPRITLISFPDERHQLNCCYTPLQTLTIPLIIETSSEH